MKKHLYLTATLAIALAFTVAVTSCNNDPGGGSGGGGASNGGGTNDGGTNNGGGNNSGGGNNPAVSNPVGTKVDMYVAGSYSTMVYNITTAQTACYWKNGVRFDLEDNSTFAGQNFSSAGRAAYIAIDGRDVYVMGEYSYGNGALYSKCYWKNGAWTEIRRLYGSSASYSIMVHDFAVSGGDVYVVGYYLDGLRAKACYWKNGEYFDLDGPHAEAIAISGGDVYIAGDYDHTDDFGFTACYWKNGQRIDLDGSQAESIAVVGGNVYAAGLYHDNGEILGKPCYWKNGTRISLYDANTLPSVNGLAVAGNDVYAAGHYWDEGGLKACYWKNGQRFDLDGQNAESIAVAGNDVYVLGYYFIDDLYVRDCFWYNGTRFDLEIDGTVNAFAVVPK